MSGNLNKKYTVELNLDVKTADAQVKKLATNINNIWADVGRASNKFSVFKDLVDYLSKIDEKIASLKHMDLNIFGAGGVNIDTALKQAIEPIIKSPEQIANVLLSIKAQLAEIQNAGNVKGATANIKQVGEALNQLYQLVGKAPEIDIAGQLGGSGKFNQKLDILTNKLNALEVSWDSLVANMNNTGNSNQTGSGVVDSVQNTTDEVQQQIDKLEKSAKQYQAILNIFNGSKTKAPTTKKTDLDTLYKLKDLFTDATNKVNEFELAGNTSGEAYKNAIANAVKYATMVKNTMNYVAEAGSVKGAQFVANQTGSGGLYDLADQFLRNMHGTDLFDDVKAYLEQRIKSVNDDINKLKMSPVGVSKMSAVSETVNANKDKEIDQLKEENEKLKERLAKQTSATASNGIIDNIQQETKETNEALEHGKKQLVAAYQNYYNAVAKAKQDGMDVLGGASSVEMLDINHDVDKMLRKWNASTKSNGSAKWELDYIKDSIVDGDLDFDRIEHQVNKIFDEAGITLDVPFKITYDEVTELKTGMSQLESIATNSFQAIATSASEVANELRQVNQDQSEQKVKDVTDTFQELVGYISKSGMSTSTFFDKLESGAITLDQELNDILQALKLIDSNGNINLSSIKSGYTNKGGFVSDQYTMIARKITGDYGQPYLKKAEELQSKLASAKQAGAQIGAIVDIVKDEAKGLFYEIQNTVQGVAAFSHHNGKVNADILEATDDQLKSLVHTLQTLQNNGLFVDYGGDNILYDKDQGFSIIDLGVKGGYGHTVGTSNTLQENLDRFIKETFKYAPSDMQPKLQSMLADRLYSMAESMGAQVVNPNAPVSTKQQSVAQHGSERLVAAVKAEEAAHEQNTNAINQENAALQAQIELKKKAQSMKWEAFALDESTADLKQLAGFQTLSDMEKFWKDANYEKTVDFYEISETKAKQIFKDKLPKGLASEWYGSANFNAKSKLENEILSDDELRNAALNYLYTIYKNSMPQEHKKDSVKTFDDFLNTEFTVFRGDSAPLIFGDESKLSFSFNRNSAKGFDHYNVGTATIKPKDTIGNAGSSFSSEIETFIPSNMTSWYKQTGESFAEFYSKQTKEMQQEIDVGLIALEKKRVSDILGNDLGKLIHQAGKESYFQSGVLKQFQQGIIPDDINIVGDGGFNDQLADMYSGLSGVQKKLVAYYATLDNLSSTLPNQFSTLWKGEVGKNANVFNAVLNDPTGTKQHVASLTGELNYNLFGKSEDKIKAETDAINQHTKAIQNNANAQKSLSSSGSNLDYNLVEGQLYRSTMDANGSKFFDMSSLWHAIQDVNNTAPDEIAKGFYTQQATGSMFKISDLIEEVNQIEQNYNENLGYVKDYLKQVSSNIDLDNLNVMSGEFDELQAYNDVKDKMFDVLQTSKGTDKYSAFNSLYNKLYDVHHADVDDISQGLYYDDNLEMYTTPQDLIDVIKRIEQEYGENLNYIKDYVNNVFSKAAADKQRSEDELDVIIDDFDATDGVIDDHIQKIDPSFVTAGLFNKAMESFNAGNHDKGYAFGNLQLAISDLSKTDQNIIDGGDYIDQATGKPHNVKELFDMVQNIEQQYGENLDHAKNYLKQVCGKLERENVDEIFDLDSIQDVDRADDSKYNKKDYVDAYQYQSDEAKAAINDLALFTQQYEDLKAKINTEPIEFLFGAGTATNSEMHEVQQTLETFKAKLEEIKCMPFFPDTEDDKNKLLELQAEVVGLQNKLRGAKLADGAASSDYMDVYDLSSLMDGHTLKKAATKPEMYPITQTLEDKFYDMQDVVKKFATFDLKYMMDDDASGALNEFLLDLSKRLQDKNVTTGLTEQFQDNIVAAQRQLSVEQDITAEKQRQVALDDVITDKKVDVVQTDGIIQEANVMDDLSIKIQEVRQAVEAKTQAFQTEGTVVSQVVQQEIDSLNKLKALLDEIQDALQVTFAASGQKFGDIDFGQNKINSDTSSSILQTIDSTLSSIYGVLQGFTGIKADNENSLQYKQVAPEHQSGMQSLTESAKALENAANQIKQTQQNVDVDQNQQSDSSKQLAKKASKQKQTPEEKVSKELQLGSLKAYKQQLTKMMDHKSIGFTSLDKGLNENQQEIADIYNDALLQIEKYIVAVKNGEQVEIGSIQDTVAALKEKVDVYKEQNTLIDADHTNSKAIDSELVKQVKKAADIEQQKLNGAFNSLDFKKYDELSHAPEKKKIADEYNQLIDVLKEYDRNASKISQEELDNTLQRTAALQKEIAAYKQKYNLGNAHGKSTGQVYGTNQLQNFNAKYNSLMAGASDVGLRDDVDVVKNLTMAYQQLLTAQNAFKVGEDLTTDVGKEKVATFKAAQLACNQYASELSKVINASKKLEADSVAADFLAEDFEDTMQGRKTALTDFVNATYGSNATLGVFKDNFNKLTFTIKNSDGTLTDMTATINAARTAINATAGDTNKMTSAFSKFTNDLWSKFKSLGTYFAASLGWQEIWQQIKVGIQHVREIDSALTELKKVTNETDATYDAFLQTMSKTAGNIGGTVKDLTTMAADWARLGYSLEEAGTLAENTAILLNVSEFDDATQASEALISTMQAFQYTADESGHVVDILNEVGEFIARR